MRLPLALAFSALLAVTACSGGSDTSAAPTSDAPTAAPTSQAPTSAAPTSATPSASALPSASGGEPFSDSIRSTFLSSCQQSALQTAGEGVDPALATQACGCLLDRLEGLYTEEEFAEFDARIADGSASAEETGRLTDLGTQCGEEAAANG